MAPSNRWSIVATLVTPYGHYRALISNLLLIGIAFAPTRPLAVVCLLARHLLSQMDVPTRQTFLMLLVEDHEREGAANLTSISRTLAQSVMSPPCSAW